VGIICCFFVFYPPIPYLTQQENYSATLSFTHNSKAVGNCQQRKEYSVTLSLNRSCSEKTIPLRCLQSSAANQWEIFSGLASP
jgi:hypothetical protein